MVCAAVEEAAQAEGGNEEQTNERLQLLTAVG